MIKIRSLIFFAILLATLSSCSQKPLFLYTDLFDRSSLASDYVKSPDPNNHPDYRVHRIVANWNIPINERGEDLVLFLKVRFGSREEEEMVYPIKKPHGHITFELRNEEVLNKKGISTFRAEIRRGDEVVYDWKHQVWEELIW